MAEETPACELEGRELEVAVEREVFGNRVERTEDGNDWICPELEVAQVTFDGDGNRTAEMVPPTVPPYTADIAAAWQVVEKIAAGGFDVSAAYFDGQPEVAIRRSSSVGFAYGKTHQAHADTAPLAICRAALKAVRHTDAPPTSP